MSRFTFLIKHENLSFCAWKHDDQQEICQKSREKPMIPPGVPIWKKKYLEKLLYGWVFKMNYFKMAISNMAFALIVRKKPRNHFKFTHR